MGETLNPLTSKELTALGLIEQYWHKQQSFPSKSMLESKISGFELDKALRHETFRLALLNRGITVPTSEEIPHTLTNEQVAAVLKVLDWEDKRSIYSKLKSLGLTTTKWQGWLKNPVFKQFLHDTSAVNFQDSIHTAQEGLVRAVDRGDVNAIKFYMQMTGRFTESSGLEQNIKLILARVIESIQRHIKDPEILKSVAADFELIMQGKPVAQPVRQLERTI